MTKEQSSLCESIIAFTDLASQLAHIIQRLTPKGRQLLNEYFAELRIVVKDAFDKQDKGELLLDTDIIAYVLQQESLSTLHAAIMREMINEQK